MTQWWLLLHIVGVVGFVASHGVSMFALLRVGKVGGNRERISELIAFSRSTVVPMYISLGLLLLGGIVTGTQTDAFNDWWIWEAIVVLVVATGFMMAVAKPYMSRLLEACTVRPSGVPRVSDEELQELLSGPTTRIVSAIGSVALVVILYLMIFRPGVR
jgi:hypothetical protein